MTSGPVNFSPQLGITQLAGVEGQIDKLHIRMNPQVRGKRCIVKIWLYVHLCVILPMIVCVPDGSDTTATS